MYRVKVLESSTDHLPWWPILVRDTTGKVETCYSWPAARERFLKGDEVFQVSVLSPQGYTDWCAYQHHMRGKSMRVQRDLASVIKMLTTARDPVSMWDEVDALLEACTAFSARYAKWGKTQPVFINGFSGKLRPE